MSRRILAVVGAFCFALVWSVPAYADSTVTIRSIPDGSANPLIVMWGCAGGIDSSNPPQFAYSVVDHSPTPETGDASWGFYFFQPGYGLGPSADVTSAADLATLQMRVSGVGAGDAIIFASPADIPSGNDGWVGTAAVSGPGTGNLGWTTVSASASTTFTWQLYDTSQNPWSPIGGTEARTLPNFELTHGTSTDYNAGFVFGCDLTANQTYHFDDFAWGASGSVTTYDFDKISQSIPKGTAPVAINAGASATISTSTNAFSALHLQQRPYGAAAWSEVRSVDGVNGVFTTKVAPMTQTAYRWEYPAEACCLEAISPAVTVKVRTAVTLKLADSTLKKGQILVASGVTKPHKPGVAVTLWRKTATGASLLASSKVHADGSYKIAYGVQSKGTWRVFVKVAAASGNLAGQSPVRSATVS